jgi:hypothetical protein
MEPNTLGKTTKGLMKRQCGHPNLQRPFKISHTMFCDLQNTLEDCTKWRTAWRQKWHLVGWNPAASYAAISLICSETQSFTLPTLLGLATDDKPGWIPGSWVNGWIDILQKSRGGERSVIRTELLWLSVPSYCLIQGQVIITLTLNWAFQPIFTIVS